MTKRCSLGILIMALSFAGCATPPAKKSFIDLATWTSPNREKVYDACLAALHMQGYTLYPLGTSKENGLLITDNKYISPKYYEGLGVYYKLQILVIKNSDTQVTISVKVSAGYPNQLADHEFLNAEINNVVSDDLKALFDEIGTVLGPAAYIRCDKVLVFQ